jgi:hypothetical protein
MKAHRGDLALVPVKPEGAGLLDPTVIWKLVKVISAPNGVANKFKWRDETAFTRSYRPVDFFLLPADRLNVPVKEVLDQVADTFNTVDEARGALIKFRKMSGTAPTVVHTDDVA